MIKAPKGMVVSI